MNDGSPDPRTEAPTDAPSTLAAAAHAGKRQRACRRCGRVAPAGFDAQAHFVYGDVAPTLVDHAEPEEWTGPLPMIDVDLRDGDWLPYTLTVPERYVPQFRCRDPRSCLVDGIPARPSRLPWHPS